MSEHDIFTQTGDAYHRLIHPTPRREAWREGIAPVVAIASAVSGEIIAAMVPAAEWRSRLLGICLAMAKQPAAYVDVMVQSLDDPRGIAIVPACAALAVLARREQFSMTELLSPRFDRAAFDGEVGWAIDKAICVAGLRTDDLPERGPNSGQVFSDHVELYDWVHGR